MGVQGRAVTRTSPRALLSERPQQLNMVAGSRFLTRQIPLSLHLLLVHPAFSLCLPLIAQVSHTLLGEAVVVFKSL